MNHLLLWTWILLHWWRLLVVHKIVLTSSPLVLQLLRKQCSGTHPVYWSMTAELHLEKNHQEYLPGQAPPWVWIPWPRCCQDRMTPVPSLPSGCWPWAGSGTGLDEIPGTGDWWRHQHTGRPVRLGVRRWGLYFDYNIYLPMLRTLFIFNVLSVLVIDTYWGFRKKR